MMSELLKRGEAFAREGQRRKVGSIAAELRALFGAAAVEVEEARVTVSGRGLMRRWLIEPSLRFLGGFK